MSTNNFFKKFIQRIKAGKKSSSENTPSSNNPQIIGNLLHMVENTDEVEIGCDEVFELLDQYVEMEQRGEDMTNLLPLVKRHLEKCCACREEYQALKQVIEASALDGS
jgi:hypothetical protein